jgi:hypothetical protein
MTRIICAAVLVFMIVGCESAEEQSTQIERVLRIDRDAARVTLDAFPSLAAVEMLKQADLSRCPTPFREAFAEYVRRAEQVVNGPLHKASPEDVAKETEAMLRAHVEVSRVALAYGVAVE